jgi:hypothetical protein
MMITNRKLYQRIFYAVAGVLPAPMKIVGALSKHLHPPLVYNEFLKRNDALLIRVVGEGETPTTACYFIFIEHLQWWKPSFQNDPLSNFTTSVIFTIIGISLQLSFLKGQAGKMGRKYPAAISK